MPNVIFLNYLTAFFLFDIKKEKFEEITTENFP